jgi:hypothetical protein
MSESFKCDNTEARRSSVLTELQFWKWGFESHPETVPQYLDIASVAVAAVPYLILAKSMVSHNIVGCSLLGPR